MVVEQPGFDFDPAVHRQPPPVVPIRDGLAQQTPAPRMAAPAPPQQRPLFTEPVQQVNTAYLQTARAVSTILATRFLLLITVATASTVWGIVVWQPTQLGIIAAGVYSVVGMWPLVFLYLRKG